MTLNSDYVRNGELNIQELFNVLDLKNDSQTVFSLYRLGMAKKFEYFNSGIMLLTVSMRPMICSAE